MTETWSEIALTFSQSIWVRGFLTGLEATFTLRDRHCTERDRENSKFFTDNDWRLGGRHLKTYPLSNSFSWGIQEKVLYPLRLFAGSFLLHLSHWSGSLCCGDSSCRRGDVTRRRGSMPVSAGQGIDAVVISSRINHDDFYQ